MLAIVAAWITGAISAGGYLGVALLMALESACTPLPSEIIMPFAGYLVSTGRFSLWGVALAGAIGCNLGSLAAYWVGITGGRAFVARYGRYVLLDRTDLEMAERFFARFGSISVLIARMLPLVRTFIAFPAGVARMRQIPFHIYTFVGSLIWCLALAYIGEVLGKHWDSDRGCGAIFHQSDLAIVALVLAVGAWFVWRRVRRH